MGLFKKKKRNNEGKIYQTTDGFFYDNNIKRNKKKRLVVAVNQRDDGALAVAKIHSKKGKKDKNYIKGVKLIPKDHPSLTEESVVSNRIIWGAKRKKGMKPIKDYDLIYSNDNLSTKELKIVQRRINGKSIRNRISYKKTLKKWNNHFKK